MVQIIQMPQRQSPMEKFTEGLGQGIANTANTYMQANIQDMFDAKKEARKQSQSIQLAHQLTKNFAQGDKGIYEELLPVVAELSKTSPDAAIKYLEGLSTENIVKMRDQRKEFEQDKVNKDNGIYPPKTDRPPMVMQGSAGNGWDAAQIPQSAQGSTNMDPVVMPGRQGTASDPRANQGVANTSPPTQNQQPPASKYRWTKNLQGQPIQVVNQLADAETEGEARAYVDQMYGKKDRKAAYAEWQKDRANKLMSEKAKTSKEGLELKKTIREEEKGKEYIESINKKQSELLLNEASLDMAEKAIKSGNTSGWLQYYAKKQGVAPLESAASAILGVAAKEFLIGTVQQVGAKGTNMFMEQRALSMFPEAGKTDEANLSLAAFHRYKLDLDKEEVRLANEMKDQYKGKEGSLQNAVHQKLAEYSEKRKEELSYTLSEIKDKYASNSDLFSTKHAIEGEYITPKRAKAHVMMAHGDVEKAQKIGRVLGYKFPGEREAQ